MIWNEINFSGFDTIIIHFIYYLRRPFTTQILRDHRIQPANNINNQRYNPSLINHREILIVAIYFNTVLLFILFISYLNIIFTGFIALVNAICFPSFFFYFNGKLRQFYQRKFWENAPTYLQPFNPDHIIEINNSDNNIELGPLPRNRYRKTPHARPRKKRTRFWGCWGKYLTIKSKYYF